MFENSNFPNYTGSPALFVSIRENGTKRSMIGFVALVTRINNEQTRFTPKCYICAFKSPHYPGFNVFARHISLRSDTSTSAF